MKKKLFIFLAISSLLIFSAFSQDKSIDYTTRVVVLIGSDGLGDYAFNDSAYNGCLEVAKKYSGTMEYSEESKTFGSDILITLASPLKSEQEIIVENYVNDGYGLVIGIGFMYVSVIEDMAKKYPQTKFALIDSSSRRSDVLNNLTCYSFKEEESSFLLGVISGLLGNEEETNDKIGFIGGMDLPIVNKYKYGFMAGAAYGSKKYRSPSMFLVDYVGSFFDRKAASDNAANQYINGAFVIYPVLSQGMYAVFDEAASRDKYAYGIDGDKAFEQIDKGNSSIAKHILASSVKRIDNTILLIIDMFKNQSLRNGNFELGVDGSYVEVAINTDSSKKISACSDRINEVIKNIGENEITVPKDQEEYMLFLSKFKD